MWWTIVPLTIISFVYFMGKGPSNGSGGRGASDFGTIYGKEVTAEAFALSQREFLIYYWLHYGEWPEKSVSFKREDMNRETYVRLLLTRKAQTLGIHISDDTVKAAAVELLQSLGRSGQPMPMDTFLQRVLAPEGLNAGDLKRFLRSDLTIQQLVQTLGLAGTLVTPQEISQLYDREHQEFSAQAVFFSASNYLAQVAVTPAAVAQFYSNNLAAYREPDRVQVSYVAFDVSNYLAQSKAEWAKTNLEENVEAVYRQYGATEFADAKSPEEAKTKIRELLIHNRALADASQQAKAFATELFAMDPAKPENLAALAKKNGLAVRTTAPFAAAFGPEEFIAPPTFTKAAFKLNTDEPLAGPIPGTDAVYVIALANQLPSTIPPLAQINLRVTQDFQQREAVMIAQRAGIGFYSAATNQMAAGKTFAQAAIAGGQSPQVLSPFSLSSSEVPEAGDHAEIGQLKQAAFTTPPGHVSNFVPTADGGFILFVQQMLPVDLARKTAELPQFTAQVRRARQNEAFNFWLQSEANRELRNTPVYAELAGKAAPR
jgi:hypothetical protein